MPTYTGTPTNNNIGGTYAGDVISGLGGNDNLVGSWGNDTITGGDGDDHIDGGDLIDVLEGGAGADRFYMSAWPHSFPGVESNGDEIRDFVPGVDKIVIISSRTFYQNLPAGPLSPDMLRITTNASVTPNEGLDGNDYFIYNQDTDTLLFDSGPTGSGIPGTRVATFSNNPAITASDIEVVRTNVVTGTSASEEFAGTASYDQIEGGAGNDRFIASPGNDWLDGQAGINTAVYPGMRANYEVRRSDVGIFTEFLVQDSDPVAQGDLGVDTVILERLRFDDISVAIDIGSTDDYASGGRYVAKILGAVFGATAVDDPRIVGIGLYHHDLRAADRDRNVLFSELTELALDARLGQTPTNRAVVELLYTNVTGNAPSESAIQYYTGLLDNGTYTQNSLAVMAANRPENATRIDLVGLAETGLNYTEYTPT